MLQQLAGGYLLPDAENFDLEWAVADFNKNLKCWCHNARFGHCDVVTEIEINPCGRCLLCCNYTKGGDPTCGAELKCEKFADYAAGHGYAVKRPGYERQASENLGNMEDVIAL